MYEQYISFNKAECRQFLVMMVFAKERLERLEVSGFFKIVGVVSKQ